MTSPGTQFWRQFRMQCRVLRALMIREIVSNFGREGLGTIWLIAEPLTFTLPVMILWYFVRSKFEHGVPMIALVWSGYMPVLLFRHVGGRMIDLVRQNADLLYHRNVTLLDTFMARAWVEIIQNVVAAILTFYFFYVPGIIERPHDLPTLVLGYFFAAWWCVTVGLFVASFCERFTWFAKIWQPIAYTYMFYSGFGYLADWLPLGIRRIALLQPSLQSYEMIREGLVGNQVITHYSVGYDTAILLLLTLLGLAGLKLSRRHMTLS